MPENKNYCVGGKCTVTNVDEQRCTFWKPGIGVKFCIFEVMVTLENYYTCTSRAANAESKDGEE